MKKRLLLATGGVFLTFCLMPSISYAQLTKPNTGGGWGNFMMPAAEMIGTMGPQGASPDPKEIEIPHQVYIHRDLLQKITGAATATNADSIKLDDETVKAAPDQTLQVGTIAVKAPHHLNKRKLNKLLASYQNSAFTLSRLQELSEKLATLYQKTGHVANIAVSSSDNNSLTFELMDITVRNVTIEEGDYFKKQALTGRVAIQEGKALRPGKLDLSLRNLESNPDLQVETDLSPVEFSNEVDVKLKIKDQRPYHLGYFHQNIQLDMFGRHLTGLALGTNNLTGLGDTLMVIPTFNRKNWGVVSHYEVPISRHGTHFIFEHTFQMLQPLGVGPPWETPTLAATNTVVG
jgi:hemolysin activation/secretion protein